MYAGAGGSFYRSTDTGETWSLITSGIISGTRLVIGVSANSPSTVYLVQTNGPYAGTLRSTDSGLTFTTMSTTPNIMDYSCDGSGTSSQASYDLCLAVDPSNANTLYCGGVNIWKSTDGGASWTINTHWVGNSWGTLCAPSVHADIHTLEWSPLTSSLYTGCDGGIYYTSSGGSGWTDISSGLSISQVYKIGQSATNQGLVMNGYQDNGTGLGNGTAFSTVIGGDGMECIIDYSNSNYRYGALYYGDIRRTTGSGYTSIKNTITETGAWVTPYILHPSDPNTMFIGYTNVWRSNNVKSSLAGTITWTSISSGESSSCSVIRQSVANPNILYVCRSNNILKRTDHAMAASPAWTTCTTPTGTISDICTHPTDSNIVYVTASTKIYKSTDKGVTWTNISGTLPATTINCVTYDKNSTEGLYIGTKTGVYFKNSGMSDWVAFSTGLPIVDVRELEIYYDATTPSNNRLKAATYGRGLWQSDLKDNLLVVTPTDQPVPALSGTTPFSVITTLAWTATSNQAWCTVTPSGTGNGTLTATYSQNTTAIGRTASITVTGTGTSPVVVTVTQAAPALTVTPSVQSVTAIAGTTPFTLASNSTWSASSDQSWCTVTPSGSGNGTLTATYQANSGSSRTANITVTVPGIAPVVVTVNQAAPSLSVAPSNRDVNANDGSTTFIVTSNANWSVVSDQPWCAPVSASGAGNGTITVNYVFNPLYTTRTANITVNVAGLTPVVITVTQAAATRPSFLYTIMNDVQTSDRTLEFDVYIMDNDPAQVFEMASIQAGFLVNSAIYNGGAISTSIVPGTSQLLTAQQPANVNWVQSQNCIKLTSRTPPGTGNGTTLSTISPGTRVCRLRITNTVPFTNSTRANLTYCFTTVPYPTKVNQYISGINTGITCNGFNCYSNCNNILLNPPTTTVNMTVLLEGLYAGAGTMSAANDENGPHWGANIADKIDIELHSGSDYPTIITTISNVDLLTNGTASFTVSNALSGSYYIVVKNRNSITTVSSIPVSFASGPVICNFTDRASRAYGDNLLMMIDGKYTIFGGDAFHDDLIDSSDMEVVDNASAFATGGYIIADVNGDGLVDSSDMAIVENNATMTVSIVTP